MKKFISCVISCVMLFCTGCGSVVENITDTIDVDVTKEFNTHADLETFKFEDIAANKSYKFDLNFTANEIVINVDTYSEIDGIISETVTKTVTVDNKKVWNMIVETYDVIKENVDMSALTETTTKSVRQFCSCIENLDVYLEDTVMKIQDFDSEAVWNKLYGYLDENKDGIVTGLENFKNSMSNIMVDVEGK